MAIRNGDLKSSLSTEYLDTVLPLLRQGVERLQKNEIQDETGLHEFLSHAR